MLAAAQAIASFKRPGAVRIERDAGLGKAFGQRRDGLHLLLAGEHAAFELEVVEAVARMGRFGEAHDRLRRQGLLVAQPQPVDRRVGSLAIGQIGLVAVADEEQIAQHLHRVALLAFAQQRRHRHAEIWPSRSSSAASSAVTAWMVVRRSKVCRPRPPASRSANAVRTALRILLQVADRLADHERPRVFERLADLLAARHFADAGVAGIVGQDDDVAGEKRPMGALRLSSMLSWPATGMTFISVTIGDDGKSISVIGGLYTSAPGEIILRAPSPFRW